MKQRTTSRGALAVLGLLSCHAAGAQSESPAVASIDIYGSRTYDSARLRMEFDTEIREYVALEFQAQTNASADADRVDPRAIAIEEKVRKAIEASGPLAYFEIHVTGSFGPPLQANVTVDVVERADAARRMPFRDAPTGELADPDGLLAAWKQYERKVLELAFAGAPIGVGPDECPVLHCITSFDPPELASYLGRFNDGARRHEQALYRIVAESGDAEARANALFLLAHTNDAERLLPALARAIYDPASGVRNNAMRVLMFLAWARPSLDFPVRDVIKAFDFPSSSDRNKAGLTLAGLAAEPRYRDAIRAEAVPIALRVLRLAQPNNHDPAYRILMQVSGETFGDRDYAAWERWAAENRP